MEVNRLAAHDPTSLELEVPVSLDVPDSEVEAWFFLPAQLGVHQPVFDRESFYRDLTAYVRYQSPRRKLVEADALLGVFRVEAERLRRSAPPPEIEAAALRALRLYGACVRAQLRRRRRALSDADAGPDVVPAFARDSEAMLQRFRALRAEAACVSPALVAALGALDDFLSMQALEVWFRAHERSPHPALAAAIVRETGARLGEGFHGPLDPRDSADNECFVSELNRLKKYVLGGLHLRFVSTRRAQAAQDLAFGIAAAVAMTVAVGLQLVAAWTFGTPGGPREWASLLPFLGFAIGGYILKDRMKEHLKGWFAQRLPTWLYDRRLELCPEDATTVLGVAEETVRLVQPTDAPAGVLALRQEGDDPIERVVRASDGVVHYRRALRLGKAASAHCPEAEAIEQILRFNVRDWLRRMDHPVRDLYRLGDDGRAHRLEGAKTYRVPVIVRIREGERTSLVRAVVVLSRDGIVRVEHPAPAPPAVARAPARARA